LRPVIGSGFHLRIAQHAGCIRRTAEPDRGGDEPLHHVALGRAHVAFVDINASGAQTFFQVHRLTVLRV
jgi:hypothetical protein